MFPDTSGSAIFTPSYIILPHSMPHKSFIRVSIISSVTVTSKPKPGDQYRSQSLRRKSSRKWCGGCSHQPSVYGNGSSSQGLSTDKEAAEEESAVVAERMGISMVAGGSEVVGALISEQTSRLSSCRCCGHWAILSHRRCETGDEGSEPGGSVQSEL